MKLRPWTRPSTWASSPLSTSSKLRISVDIWWVRTLLQWSTRSHQLWSRSVRPSKKKSHPSVLWTWWGFLTPATSIWAWRRRSTWTHTRQMVCKVLSLSWQKAPGRDLHSALKTTATWNVSIESLFSKGTPLDLIQPRRSRTFSLSTPTSSKSTSARITWATRVWRLWLKWSKTTHRLST